MALFFGKTIFTYSLYTGYGLTGRKLKRLPDGSGRRMNIGVYRVRSVMQQCSEKRNIDMRFFTDIIIQVYHGRL